MSWLDDYFPDTQTVCVAEIGLNHGGNVDRACRMIEAAHRAGADAVKFQTIHPDSLYSVYSTSYSEGTKPIADTSIIDFFNGCSLSDDDYVRIKQCADKAGIPFFPTVFDFRGIEMLDRLGVPFFKVASSDITHLPLIERIAKCGKPVIVSTGMATHDDIQAILGICSEIGVMLLHCVSLYPAPENLLHIRTVSELIRTYSVPTGFSDHSRNEFGYLGAVACGARMIERHFTDIHGKDVLDDIVSFDEAEFGEMVRNIRKMEDTLRLRELPVTAEEREMMRLSRRSVYALRDIPEGTVITMDMLCWKRPEAGIPANQTETVCGARAAVDIQKDRAITFEMLEGVLT
ncbi:MAG: N-acetylneuraminate synthase family protein [Spirochaetota bacterium]